MYGKPKHEGRECKWMDGWREGGIKRKMVQEVKVVHGTQKSGGSWTKRRMDGERDGWINE